MSEMTIERGGGNLGRVSLALGVLAPILFFLGTVAGIFWFVGAVIGLAAVVAGIQTLRRRERGERAMAVAGIVLGAVIAGWFVLYLVLEAV